MAGRERGESEICSRQCHPLLPVGGGNLGQPTSPWACFCCTLMEGWPALLGEHSSLLFTSAPERSTETCGGNRHPEAEAGGIGKMFSMQKKVTSVRSCLCHVALGWLGLHNCLFNNTSQAALGPHSFGEEEDRNRTKQALARILHISCQKRQHLQSICSHPDSSLRGWMLGRVWLPGWDWQCWRKCRVKVRDVFLGVPAMAVPCVTPRDATWGGHHWPQHCLGLCGVWWPQREVGAPGSARCSWWASLVEPRVSPKSWAQGTIKGTQWHYRDNIGYEQPGQWAYSASHSSLIYSYGNFLRVCPMMLFHPYFMTLCPRSFPWFPKYFVTCFLGDTKNLAYFYANKSFSKAQHIAFRFDKLL